MGAENAFGRSVVEAHYRVCLSMGIKISGINGEVAPGQWEFQVGPCEGIEGADQLIMARFALLRVAGSTRLPCSSLHARLTRRVPFPARGGSAEDFGLVVTFDPKPVPGDVNGSGCHTNVSTLETRARGGYDKIEEYMKRLGAPGKRTCLRGGALPGEAGLHADAALRPAFSLLGGSPAEEEHIAAYDPSGGADNARRLTGKHETASIKEFSYGVANRGASVRIPRSTQHAGRGYFEDRRPASNMDPYVVTAKIMETCVLPDYEPANGTTSYY